MRNIDKLLNILNCTDEIDEDVITFFVWYNSQISEISISVARECVKELKENNNKKEEKDKEIIESIIINLRDEELQSYLMRNIDKLLNILNCTDEIDEDVITFFVWYNSQISEISISVARECVKELKENNYL